MAFRCIAAIPNGGGNCIQKFYEDTPEGHAEAEAFAREYDRPGMGVYDCVSTLKEARRSKESVAEIAGLHYDIDARQTNETKEQIVERVRAKLDAFGILSRMVDSGRGVHIYSMFREPIVGGTPEAEKAEHLLVRMIEHLGADPAPKHFAALMRRLGTTNSKEGAGPCQVILDTGARCELSNIESYLDLVEANGALFTRNVVAAKANGADSDFVTSGHKSQNEPIDVEARLAPGGTGKSSLVMVEAVSMATGRALLGEAPPDRMRVWYHNGEDNYTELQRRVAGICQYYEVPMTELEGWFFMTSGTEVWGALFTAFGRCSAPVGFTADATP